MKKAVKVQKIKEIKSHRDSSKGEHSPYWDYVNDGADEFGENSLANPDALASIENTPSTPQLIMGEAIDKLVGRQKECYLLTMREGKTFAETALILGISAGTVQKYKERAVRFIEGYCQQALNRGRV